MKLLFKLIIVLVCTALGAFFLSIANRRVIEGENGEQKNSSDGEAGQENKRMGGYLSVFCLAAVCAAMMLTKDKYYRESLWDIWKCELLLSCLWGCARSDRIAKIIPNQILLLTILIRSTTIMLRGFAEPEELRYELAGSLLAALTMFAAAIMCRLISRGALGFGDVKLLTVMGFCLTLDRIWGAVFFSMLCCFCYSVFILLSKRGTVHTEIPFAPLLLAGTVLSYFLTGV